MQAFPPCSSKDTLTAFRVFDRAGVGHISFCELEAILRNGAHRLSLQGLKGLVTKAMGGRKEGKEGEFFYQSVA